MDWLKYKRSITVKTKGEVKTLEMTDEQYGRLLFLITLGRRTFDDNPEEIRGLEDINQYILSFSEKFNAQKKVRYTEELDFYFPTNFISKKVEKIIKKFEYWSFFDRLVDHFTDREVELFAEKGIKKTEDEKDYILEKYSDEFAKNEFRNLELKKQSG